MCCFQAELKTLLYFAFIGWQKNGRNYHLEFIRKLREHYIHYTPAHKLII